MLFRYRMHILIHPGWQDSGPEHWQSLWQNALPGSERVAQADWDHPQLDEWVATLHRHILAAPAPVLLVCHSLGCATLVHWASRHRADAHRIGTALLVAPADVERADAPQEIRGFATLPRAALPFPTRLVASDDDPFCQLARSRDFAAAWQAELTVLEAAGHINASAGFGAWPQGLALLQALQAG